MTRSRIGVHLGSVCVLTVALGLLAALTVQTASTSGQPALQVGKVPKIQARTKPIIVIDRLQFRDLNANATLDPYEDWRLPVVRRVADLLSRMTLEEKAGLMQITSFRGESLDDYVNTRHIRF